MFKEAPGGKLALHYAADEGHAEVVAFFLDQGMDVDVADHQGLTCLYIACYRGYADLVKLLLDKDADPCHQGKPYKTSFAPSPPILSYPACFLS